MDAVTIMVWVVLGILGGAAAGVYHLRRLYKAEITHAETAARQVKLTESALEGTRAQMEVWRLSTEGAEKAVEDRDKLVAKLEAENAGLKQALHFREHLQARAFNREAKVVTALAAVNSDNPLWQAVLQIIHDQHEDEIIAANSPNLSDGSRHYNSGRAAALDDIQVILTRSRLKAQTEQLAA